MSDICRVAKASIFPNMIHLDSLLSSAWRHCILFCLASKFNPTMRSLKRLLKIGAILVPIAILFLITRYTNQTSSTSDNVLGIRKWIVGNDPKSMEDRSWQ